MSYKATIWCLVLFSLLGVGCSANQINTSSSNDQNDPLHLFAPEENVVRSQASASVVASQEPERDANGDYFDEKVKCASYIDKVKDGIREMNRDVQTTNLLAMYVRVFYSPKLNTCISETKFLEKGVTYYVFNDILTDALIRIVSKNREGDQFQFVLEAYEQELSK